MMAKIIMSNIEGKSALRGGKGFKRKSNFVSQIMMGKKTIFLAFR